jgi:NAD(P)-dependent dehydrogenase (short-subunit alcohol dehydrogenase family)
MLLKDKVVVVSGVGPGLGQALAVLAAREGARLVLGELIPSRLDDAEREISTLPDAVEILKVPTDITQRAACDALVQAALQRFGRIDGLVNDAFASGTPCGIADADFDDWRRIMEVNLFGSLNMCRAVFAPMKAQGRGSIVNINTMGVRLPVTGQAAYAAAKAALAQSTVQLASEWGPYGIRVNSTFMGWMWGPSVIAHFRSVAPPGQDIDALRAQVAANAPLRIMPADRDCARPIITLLSDYMDVVTGASLDINAGAYMPM